MSSGGLALSQDMVPTDPGLVSCAGLGSDRCPIHDPGPIHIRVSTCPLCTWNPALCLGPDTLSPCQSPSPEVTLVTGDLCCVAASPPSRPSLSSTWEHPAQLSRPDIIGPHARLSHITAHVKSPEGDLTDESKREAISGGCKSVAHKLETAQAQPPLRSPGRREWVPPRDRHSARNAVRCTHSAQAVSCVGPPRVTTPHSQDGGRTRRFRVDRRALTAGWVRPASPGSDEAAAAQRTCCPEQ